MTTIFFHRFFFLTFSICVFFPKKSKKEKVRYVCKNVFYLKKLCSINVCAKNKAFMNKAQRYYTSSLMTEDQICQNIGIQMIS